MTHDDDREPSALPGEVEDALAFAYGEDDGGESPSPSVLDRIAERTGHTPRVSLRDGVDGDEPILRPLGPDDPRRTGRYVVHGELGRGGVGTVHRGHDQELGRDVALKFLREKYREDPEILQRFVEEAQIGGQLQHPGIVPVYDLGIARGRPFFAMKLVKGETLAKRLAERPSLASDRHALLSIFEDVCQTMAYAHARGVVHRDLKPANVMIGAFGEVQVVDWGVGKVLRQGGVDDERLGERYTRAASVIETVRSRDDGSSSLVGSVMGTPSYMPPEQARGEVDAMDERSDVFALGAILCEILTGQPPYVGEREEVMAKAASADLADARERLAGCGADGALVELAERCLQPAPPARPANAEVLAVALQTHLAAVETRARAAQVEAAEARVRSAALERTRALAAGLIVAITAGLVASLWLWREADASAQEALRNEQRAERELARALEIKRLVAGMLNAVSPSVAQLSDTTLVKSILDRTADRLLRGEVEDELVAAELHWVVGNAYQRISLHDDARRHLSRSQAIRERLLGPGRHETLRSRAAMAHLDYALGDFDAAETGFREVLERHDCPDGRACDLVRYALPLLASAVLNQGREDEAEGLLLEALEIVKERFGVTAIEALEAWIGLGQVYLSSGRPDEAERHLRRALEVTEEVLGPEHPDTLRAMSALARLESERGRYEVAWPLFRRAVEVCERVFGAEHELTLNVRQNFGLELFRGGALQEAESELAATLAIYERVLGPEHPAALNVAANLAGLLVETGRLDEARAAHEELLPLLVGVHGEEHPKALRVRANLALIHALQGRRSDAESLLEDVIAVEERTFGAEHPNTLSTKYMLATSVLGVGHRAERCESLLLEILRARSRDLGRDDPDTLHAAGALAMHYQDAGRLEEAERLFERTVDGWTNVLGAGHPFTLYDGIQLGITRMMRGGAGWNVAELIALLEELERGRGRTHQHTLAATTSLGVALEQHADHAAAVEVLEPRVDAFLEVYGSSTGTWRVVTTLARAYAALGRGEDALRLQAEVLALGVDEARASDDPVALNDAAWNLLTHEFEELHDPDLAAELAARACELEESRGGDALWAYLDTLALAQDRSGDVASAVRTQRRALAAMPAGADPGVERRLAEYEAALEDDR